MAAKHFLSLEISEECGYCYTVSYFLSVHLFTPFHAQSNSNLQAYVVESALTDVGFFL